MKLLLDTNVLLDYYAKREPFFEDTLQLRMAALFGDVELWASTQSFTDIEYILRGSAPLSEIRTAIKHSLELMSICSPSPSDLEPGLDSSWPDLEDYLISKSAERIKADFIITRDEKGFGRSNIEAISPSDFLNLLSEEYGITYEKIGLADL